jgi:hypothetical protein
MAAALVLGYVALRTRAKIARELAHLARSLEPYCPESEVRP